MISLSAHPEGWVFSVRAQPGARKRGIQGERAGALRVAVTAPPQDGRANQAIAELLRETFDLKRSQLELVGGEKSRQKRFLVRGVAKAELEALLGAVVGGHPAK
jgi:uncharacterized protein